MTAEEWKKRNPELHIPSSTAREGSSSQPDVTYKEYISQQSDNFVMKGSMCAAMRMDIDQCGSDKLLENMLVQQWRSYFPGHACRSNARKYMCMVCKFIAYTWVHHDFSFWAYRDTDMELARRLGMDD